MAAGAAAGSKLKNHPGVREEITKSKPENTEAAEVTEAFGTPEAGAASGT
jgi:hypothetical protein